MNDDVARRARRALQRLGARRSSANVRWFVAMLTGGAL